jgi:hypothetical protein
LVRIYAKEKLGLGPNWSRELGDVVSSRGVRLSDLSISDWSQTELDQIYSHWNVECPGMEALKDHWIRAKKLKDPSYGTSIMTSGGVGGGRWGGRTGGGGAAAAAAASCFPLSSSSSISSSSSSLAEAAAVPPAGAAAAAVRLERLKEVVRHVQEYAGALSRTIYPDSYYSTLMVSAGGGAEGGREGGKEGGKGGGGVCCVGRGLPPC